jgi:hypothetical protein
VADAKTADRFDRLTMPSASSKGSVTAFVIFSVFFVVNRIE